MEVIKNTSRKLQESIIKLLMSAIKKLSGDTRQWKKHIKIFKRRNHSVYWADVKKFNHLLLYLEKNVLYTISRLFIIITNYNNILSYITYISAPMCELFKLRKIVFVITMWKEILRRNWLSHYKSWRIWKEIWNLFFSCCCYRTITLGRSTILGRVA